MFLDSGNVAGFHMRARTSSKFLGATVGLKNGPKSETCLFCFRDMAEGFKC